MIIAAPADRLHYSRLPAVTGLVDAVSYLRLGRVFVANMTGNVVFLGFSADPRSGLSAAASVIAIAGFLLGALAGGRPHGACRTGDGPHGARCTGDGPAGGEPGRPSAGRARTGLAWVPVGPRGSGRK